MAFLVFRRPKMIEKKDAVLILAVEFKSEEKTSLSLLEKKISNFCPKRFLGKSIKIAILNFAIFRRAITFFSGNMPV